MLCDQKLEWIVILTRSHIGRKFTTEPNFLTMPWWELDVSTCGSDSQPLSKVVFLRACGSFSRRSARFLLNPDDWCFCPERPLWTLKLRVRSGHDLPLGTYTPTCRAPQSFASISFLKYNLVLLILIPLFKMSFRNNYLFFKISFCSFRDQG